MANKFEKTRKSIGRDRVESLTGTSLKESDNQAKFKRRLEEAKTEEEKKKIRQAAHFQGISLD